MSTTWCDNQLETPPICCPLELPLSWLIVICRCYSFRLMASKTFFDTYVLRVLLLALVPFSSPFHFISFVSAFVTGIEVKKSSFFTLNILFQIKLRNRRCKSFAGTIPICKYLELFEVLHIFVWHLLIILSIYFLEFDFILNSRCITQWKEYGGSKIP